MRSAVSHSSCSTWATDSRVVVQAQALLCHAKRQKHDRVVAVELRARLQVAEDLGYRQTRIRVFRQLLALVDDRARNRVVEHALRQFHVHRLALAGLAQRIGRDEADLDRQAGPGMGRQIVIAGCLGLLEVQTAERQFELDPVAGLAALGSSRRITALTLSTP